MYDDDDDEDDYPHLPQNPLGLAVVIVGGTLSWGVTLAGLAWLLSLW